MNRNHQNNFFWVSYTDLMTSLFFIMLVLYVLTFVKQRYQQKATEDQLRAINEIETSVKELPQSYFEYEPEYKRYALNKQIQFDKKKSNIKEEYHDYLIDVGSSIDSLIQKLQIKYSNENIKYMIVIEGMASNDNYINNYELSYERALSLWNFWLENGIEFDPKICEVQIAGSGTGGIRKYSGDEEYKNQRFLIQIIPKIGEIKLEK